VLNDHIQRVLRAHGAHVDDLRYCPFDLEGTVSRFSRASDMRKPDPGMILDLMKHWPIDMADSMVIGDKPSDMAAAGQVGIKCHLFAGGNLLEFVTPLVQ
jgi:D-glycero-D-manno-heptose 1,7-bisphosphate phosphatase